MQAKSLVVGDYITAWGLSDVRILEITPLSKTLWVTVLDAHDQKQYFELLKTAHVQTKSNNKNEGKRNA